VSCNSAFGANFTGFTEARSWYFDRLGKTERFQRQVYSLSVTPMPDQKLFLGLATVIEWPKVGSLAKSHAQPPFAHDIMSVYLATSRDGELFDLSGIYSYNRLIPRGSCQQQLIESMARNGTGWLEASTNGCEFDHGYVQPASEIVTSLDGRHHLYYEGRPVQHEDRWHVPARIGVATWDHHRLAALSRAPDVPGGACGVVTLRPFALNVSTLTVNADVPTNGAALTVSVFDALLPTVDQPLLQGHAIGNGRHVKVIWGPVRRPEPLQHSRLLQLRFQLCGLANLFAFTVGKTPVHPSPNIADSPRVLHRRTSRRWLSPSAASFSYVSHSGFSNQLFSLMNAVRIAHATGLQLVVPQLLLSKTIGPLCGQCQPREHSGGPQNLHRNSSPLSDILNTSALHDIGVSAPERHTASFTTIYLCHIHRRSLQLTLQGRCDPNLFDALVKSQCAHQRARTVPVSCLRSLVSQHGISSTGHAPTRLHLQLGSLYEMVEGGPSVDDAPLLKPAPPELSFSDIVINAATIIVRRVASIASTGRFACAHLRMGHGTWDVVPTFFARRSSAVLSAFGGWVKEVMNGTKLPKGDRLHVLIVTDDASTAASQKIAHDCLHRKACSFIEEHFVADPRLPLQSMPLVAAVSQEVCSSADNLLLTKGSSFSALIEMLWNRRMLSQQGERQMTSKCQYV